MSNQATGECRHFASYSGVKLPLKMVNPLTEADLQNRNTFFRSYFDDKQRMTLCQKLVYGEIELQHKYYYYDNNTLKQADITDTDGELNTIRFNENGKPL